MSSEEIPTIGLPAAPARPESPEAPTQELPQPGVGTAGPDRTSSSDAAETVETTASAPAASAHTPAQPRPADPRVARALASLWLGRAQQFLALGIGLVLAALWQLRGLGWAASAASWLQGTSAKGGVGEAGAVAVLWRRGVAWGVSLAHVVSLWQFLAAGLLVTLLLLVAWRLRGLAAAGVALALLLLWPTSRTLLGTVGAEVPLAAGLLGAVLAGLLAWPRPLLSALLLGGTLAVLVLVHPVGLPLAIVTALAVLILPLRRGVEPLPGIEPHEGLWPHAVAVPNLSGLLLAVGLVAASHGRGGFQAAWTERLAAWRAPVASPWLGGLAQAPVLGHAVAIAAQVPLALLVLAISAAIGAIRRPTDVTALPSGVFLGAWLALVWLGLPVPGMLDGVAVLAPLVVLLASVMVTDVTRELWARGTSGAKTGGVVLWFAALLALLADVHLAAPDRRHVLGHVPGVVQTLAASQPAVLRPADIGLLYKKPVATTVLPGHPGGNALAQGLRQLHPPLAGINYGAAFSTDLVLIDARPGSPLEAMWQHVGTEEACSADGARCLVRIRGRK